MTKLRSVKVLKDDGDTELYQNRFRNNQENPVMMQCPFWDVSMDIRSYFGAYTITHIIL